VQQFLHEFPNFGFAASVVNGFFLTASVGKHDTYGENGEMLSGK